MAATTIQEATASYEEWLGRQTPLVPADLVRRLAPDRSRVELSALPGQKHEAALLQAMGWETANIHVGTANAPLAILEHLQQRADDWLLTASRRMLRAVDQDWKAWRS